MSRFNAKSTPTKKATTNLAGGKAYALNPEFELYTLVCSSILADKYYETADNAMNRVRELVDACDAQFVSNLAAYARHEMYLRSMPMVLAVTLAQVKGGSVARQTFPRVINRVDEIMESLAFYGASNKHAATKASGAHNQITKHITKRPNSMIRGLRDVFQSGRFKEYHYAKYDRKGTFTLRDALFLTHPKPSHGQDALFKRIANKELKTPDTWEVAISAAGKDEDDKLRAWSRLINEGKLGHMALLRNLRNILQLKPSEELVKKVCDTLVIGAPNGKQFPFRYWAAFRELANIHGRSYNSTGGGEIHLNIDPFAAKHVMRALDDCLKISVQKVPQLKGRTMIACDVSGSMNTTISPKSKVQNFDIGLVLGAILYARDPSNTLMGMFGDTWKFVKPTGSVLADVCSIHAREGEVGYATNGYLAIADITKRGLSVDNVLFFTDGQMYGGDLQKYWSVYKRDVNPHAKLYVFDLAGHGATPLQINGKDTFVIAGWNDRIFEACQRMTEGESALDVIRNYTGPKAREEYHAENGSEVES